jgi:hypothetical protein
MLLVTRIDPTVVGVRRKKETQFLLCRGVQHVVEGVHLMILSI